MVRSWKPSGRAAADAQVQVDLGWYAYAHRVGDFDDGHRGRSYRRLCQAFRVTSTISRIGPVRSADARSGSRRSCCCSPEPARPARVGEQLADDPTTVGRARAQARTGRDRVGAAGRPGRARRGPARPARELATAAGERGVLAAGLGTSPSATLPDPTPDERYQRMQRQFGLVAADQLTCGTHVHVSVGSRAEGIAAIDGVRRWMAVLLAHECQLAVLGRPRLRLQRAIARSPGDAGRPPVRRAVRRPRTSTTGACRGSCDRRRGRPRDDLLRRPAVGQVPDGRVPHRRQRPADCRLGAARGTVPCGGRDRVSAGPSTSSRSDCAQQHGGPLGSACAANSST